jgi:hypothetical protein
MFILQNSNLPITNKTISRGLPLFNLKGSGIVNSSYVVNNPDSTVIEQPSLIKHSEGYLIKYSYNIADENLTESGYFIPTELNSYKNKFWYTSEIPISGFFTIQLEFYTSQFTLENSSFLYSIELPYEGSITKVISDGLTFEGDSISYENNILLVQGSKGCKLRPHDPESTTTIFFELNKTSFVEIYKAIVFDFSDQEIWGDINAIQTLDYKNISYYESFSPGVGSLIFNPFNKLCICLCL